MEYEESLSGMRIALVHYSCPPIIGGVEFIVAEHAQLLAEHGCDVDVIVGEGDQFRDDVAVKVIPELGSLPRSKLRSLLRSGEAQAEVDALKGLLRDALCGYDVCAVHNMLSMHFNPIAANALAQLAADGEIPPVVAWVHDASLLSDSYRKMDFTGPLWSYLGRRIANVAYVVISGVRRGQIAQLCDIPEDDITVIPDGVDLKSFLSLTDRACRIFDAANLRGVAAIALTPTRIVRRKNLEAGIEIIHELKKLGKSVRWLITGAADRHNPATRAYLEELQADVAQRGLEEEVRFLGADGGRVRYKTLRSLYRLCDFVLLPSTDEGFGIPVLEAGLSKRLVVLNDIPVFHEVADEHAIYIGGDCSPADAARAIAYFLDNDRATLLKKHVQQNYLWKAVFTRHIEPFFRQMASVTNNA